MTERQDGKEVRGGGREEGRRGGENRNVCVHT